MILNQAQHGICSFSAFSASIITLAVQKFGISKMFNVFLRSFLCLSRLYLFDQKHRKIREIFISHSEILLQFKITFLFLFTLKYNYSLINKKVKRTVFIENVCYNIHY